MPNIINACRRLNQTPHLLRCKRSSLCEYEFLNWFLEQSDERPQKFLVCGYSLFRTTYEIEELQLESCFVKFHFHSYVHVWNMIIARKKHVYVFRKSVVIVYLVVLQLFSLGSFIIAVQEPHVLPRPIILESWMKTLCLFACLVYIYPGRCSEW